MVTVLVRLANVVFKAFGVIFIVIVIVGLTQGRNHEVPVSFEIGEEVWLDAKNIKLKSKLAKLKLERVLWEYWTAREFNVISQKTARFFARRFAHISPVHVLYVVAAGDLKSERLGNDNIVLSKSSFAIWTGFDQEKKIPETEPTDD
ncbi:hypothetical protein RSAG8_12504, partial [Rhizoctonia solani AG-8 WAC10335]